MSSEAEKKPVQKNESSITDGGYNRIGVPSPVTSMTILHPNETILDIVGDRDLICLSCGGGAAKTGIKNFVRVISLWRDDESECLEMQTLIHCDTENLYISNVSASQDGSLIALSSKSKIHICSISVKDDLLYMSIDCEQATVAENSKIEQKISCFSNDNSIIATGLSDGTIKLWSIQKEKIDTDSPNNEQQQQQQQQNNNKDKKSKKSKKGKKEEVQEEEKPKNEENAEEEEVEEAKPIDRYRYSLKYIREINHRQSSVKDMSFNPSYEYLSVIYEDGYCELINLRSKNLATTLVLEPPHIEVDDSNTPIKTILKKGKFLSENELVCSYTSARKGYIVCYNLNFRDDINNPTVDYILSREAPSNKSITTVVVNPEMNFIGIGTNNGSVGIYNKELSENIVREEAHDLPATCGVLFPKDDNLSFRGCLVTGSLDSSINVASIIKNNMDGQVWLIIFGGLVILMFAGIAGLAFLYKK